MLCSAIMTRNPDRIVESETIGSAAAGILKDRAIELLVVDGKGRLAGLFGIYELLTLLVPRVAVIGNLAPNVRFAGGDPAELQAKFAAIAGKPLKDAVNREAARVYPDTPVMDAIRLFCNRQTTIPVVERDSGMLTGMLSYWDIARVLTQPSQ